MIKRLLIILITLYISQTQMLFAQPCNCGSVSYADAVAKAAPAVVSIQTAKKIPMEQHPLFQDPFFRFRFFGDQDYLDEFQEQDQLQHGLGSGVIINSKGYVLTNNHVIKGATSIVVKLPDNRTANADIVGVDPQTDLAILKIQLNKLPVITLGSSSKLRVGDVVLAIGNPFGFDRTVTQGIVSATDSLSARTNEKVLPSIILDNLIQTDAAINPGNSGGALIDAYGNLIGINTAIISGSGGYQGIGFAIPIDTAKEIMTQLIEKGFIVRGWLGSYLGDLNKKVYVQGIIDNSPAQRAGIMKGDIIAKINKIEVHDTLHVIRLVSGLEPGKQYPIEVIRKGKRITFAVVLGKRPTE